MRTPKEWAAKFHYEEEPTSLARSRNAITAVIATISREYQPNDHFPISKILLLGNRGRSGATPSRELGQLGGTSSPDGLPKS